MIALIDGAASRHYPADGQPFCGRLRAGRDADEGEAFVQVESLFYPDLGDHFAEQAAPGPSAGGSECRG